MLFKSTISLVLASLTSLASVTSLAAAAPVGNQSPHILRVTLFAHILGNREEVFPSVDGDAAPVPGSFGYPVGGAQIQCIGPCPPKYHCTMYDRHGKAYATLSGEGGKLANAQPVSKVSCASG